MAQQKSAKGQIMIEMQDNMTRGEILDDIASKGIKDAANIVDDQKLDLDTMNNDDILDLGIEAGVTVMLNTTDALLKASENRRINETKLSIENERLKQQLKDKNTKQPCDYKKLGEKRTGKRSSDMQNYIKTLLENND